MTGGNRFSDRIINRQNFRETLSSGRAPHPYPDGQVFSHCVVGDFVANTIVTKNQIAKQNPSAIVGNLSYLALQNVKIHSTCRQCVNPLWSETMVKLVRVFA